MVCDVNALLYSVSMYLLRLQIKPLCWVDVGEIVGQYNIWCQMWWKRVVIICSSLAPRLTNLLASSLPITFVCALYLLMVMLCVEVFMAVMMYTMRALFMWMVVVLGGGMFYGF